MAVKKWIFFLTVRKHSKDVLHVSYFTKSYLKLCVNSSQSIRCLDQQIIVGNFYLICTLFMTFKTCMFVVNKKTLEPNTRIRFICNISFISVNSNSEHL